MSRKPGSSLCRERDMSVRPFTKSFQNLYSTKINVDCLKFYLMYKKNREKGEFIVFPFSNN
jgi:hypothetical protein